MKLLAFRSTWGLVDDSDGEKALVNFFSASFSKSLCVSVVTSQDIGHGHSSFGQIGLRWN